MKHYSMRYEKFGNFVAELRRRKGCTQIELAKVLHVSNKTVSKWECGNSLPDITMLIPLSEALNISVTELLLGHYIEDDKVNKSDVEEMTINNLKDSKQKFSKKLYKIIIAFIVFIIITILAIYFFTTFNSVKLYRVTLNSNDFVIESGTFMHTKIQSYFELGKITYNGNQKIQGDLKVKLYTLDNGDETVLYEGLYLPIYICEDYGYEEYLTDEFEQLIQDNLYITIKYTLEDGQSLESTYKLDVVLKFSNNKLFNYKKDDGATESDDDSISYELDTEHILINNGFECEKELEDKTCLNKVYIKYDGNYLIRVTLVDEKTVNVNCDNIFLNYSLGTNKLKIMKSDQLIFSGGLSEIDAKLLNEKKMKTLIKYLNNYLDELKR